MNGLTRPRPWGGCFPWLGPWFRYICPALLASFTAGARAQEVAPPGAQPASPDSDPAQDEETFPEDTPAPSAPADDKSEPAPSEEAARSEEAPAESAESATDPSATTESVDQAEVDPPSQAASAPLPTDEVEVIATVDEDVHVPDNPQPLEVTVVGSKVTSGVDRTTRAVTVIDLERARLESGDLGEVISRAEGVNVQRGGGLGSAARFSLAGFDEKQVRFFIDGVPLEFAGYTFGMQNVPVNFATRVETFKGVVPVYFGSDALGGAFNLVTDRATKGVQAFASYSMGSFGLLRMSASGRYLHGRTGIFVKAEGFYDKSDNNYPVYVDVSSSTGVSTETKVHRFHDAYRAGGGNLEVGWVDRSWARRLLLRGFATSYGKELQHNSIMTVPYGEVQEEATSLGANLRYENTFTGDVAARAVGGYVHDRLGFLDKSECVYNWFGQCANSQLVPGELSLEPRDVQLREHTGFLRSNVDWRPHEDHMLRFATSPTYHFRTGDDHEQDDNDALNAKRKMFKWVNGLEYEAHLFAGRLLNSAFIKNYFQTASSLETFQDKETLLKAERFLWGFGDGMRVDLLDWVFMKASYEYATRLPEFREVFGNGGFILDNLELVPERSHNVNLTLALDDLVTPIGNLTGNATGFFRDADNLIVLFPIGDSLRYENVYSARVRGIEGSLTWISPGDYVEIGSNVTFQDVRNTSNEGQLGLHEGERIPNKPYLFGNAWIRLQKTNLAANGDLISLTWRTRYTHEFYRNWEGSGIKRDDDIVPTQLTHNLVLSYLTSIKKKPQLTFSTEMQNLTDERVYDFYGAQRPGRAYFCKVTMTL